jgi:N6-L-threonylcarbamoyladenine synthase
MHVLGIETSCDETAAAVLTDGRLRSNVVASQADLHARYGGVVPELASRRHLERLWPVVDEALMQADVTLQEIQGVAVTCGPGLAGALTVGVAAAKTMASAAGLPLIGVNHLEGHIYANFLEHPDVPLPALVLIVSGAHTDLLVMLDHGRYAVLGRTRDDAAGEAFDKVARVLGLGYPGGPAIETLARSGHSGAVKLPLPFATQASFDFSFSGLKTAVARASAAESEMGDRERGKDRVEPPAAQADGIRPNQFAADLAAAFQRNLVEVLAAKTARAARGRTVGSLLLAGGVAANSVLRARMADVAAAGNLPLFVPPPALCTDNAAMIACAGVHRLARGCRSSSRLGAYADLDLEDEVPETVCDPQA